MPLRISRTPSRSSVVPFYLIQASYGSQATGTMIKKPQDRAAAVRPMIERMGGRLHGLWFAFGEFDVVAIAEAPDNVSAAALAMAIGASGAMSSYRTTPLLTVEEAMQAMKKAGQAGYKPPK
jgi:uncharacterized protein with GYD domain